MYQSWRQAKEAAITQSLLTCNTGLCVFVNWCEGNEWVTSSYPDDITDDYALAGEWVTNPVNEDYWR